MPEMAANGSISLIALIYRKYWFSNVQLTLNSVRPQDVRYLIKIMWTYNPGYALPLYTILAMMISVVPSGL